MTDTNDDGIETKRPVKSIYDVSERRLNRYRLADLKTREEYWCLSSPEWCEANPMDGRDSVERGEIEWFLDEEKR